MMTLIAMLVALAALMAAIMVFAPVVFAVCSWTLLVGGLALLTGGPTPGGPSAAPAIALLK